MGRIHVSPDKDGLWRVDTYDKRNLWAASTLGLLLRDQ